MNKTNNNKTNLKNRRNKLGSLNNTYSRRPLTSNVRHVKLYI